jgi:CubicO group peptidase (beta-lactamase class C family)
MSTRFFGSRVFGLGLIAALATLAAYTAATAAAARSRTDQAAEVPTSSQAVRANQPDAAAAETRNYLRRLEKLGFAGVVLVARGAAPLFADGFGLADRERGLRWTPATVSTVGSITKQFTAAAILKLEEEGKLSVSDPISRYFPHVPADKAGITLHNLLTHSSGLSDPDLGDFEPVTLADYLRMVFATPLRIAPGTGYSYENANFSLLGAIIEELSGESYEEFVRERLFLPNGMYETGYKLPLWGEGRLAQGYLAGKPWGTILGRPMAADGPYWALRANGGIHTTAYDMLRWARALLEGRALTPASMKKLWAPYSNEGGGTYYGYGWSIAKAPDGAKIVTHNGGNGIYFADLAIMPDTGLVVFLMTNVISENRSANALLQQLGLRFHAGTPYPAIPEIVDMNEAAMAAYVGTYRMEEEGSVARGRAVAVRGAKGRGAAGVGPGGFRVTQEGGALFIEAEGGKAFDALNSVRAAEPGRLDRLNRLTDRIIAENLRGEFGPIFKAYGGHVPIERLKASWADSFKALEKDHGRFLRYEVLGTARTEERDETVVRFAYEKGHADMTYVWDLDVEGRLLGRSARGLKARMRLYPSGERDFFTWDGGVRPPKAVHFEPGADGRTRVKVGGRSGTGGERAPMAVAVRTLN